MNIHKLTKLTPLQRKEIYLKLGAASLMNAVILTSVLSIGNPRACRAVGMANNKNPMSIVVPSATC